MTKRSKSPSKTQDPVYPKEKTEDYLLLGGINTKVSLYSNGPAEFRDLSNLNFINTGALTKRPGTTLYGGVTLPGATLTQISGGFEFSKLNGISFIITTSTSYISQWGATFNTPIIYYQNQSPLQFGGIPVPTGVVPGAISSSVAFVDRLFICEGQNFYRINTTSLGFSTGHGPLNAYLYSLPPTNLIALTQGISQAFGFSGNLSVAASFVNDRGYVGPVGSPIGITTNNSTSYQWTVSATYISFMMDVYGVTAIQVYRSIIDGAVLNAVTLIPTVHGATFSWIDTGASLSNTAAVAPNTFYLPGAEEVEPASVNFPFYGRLFIPRFLEVYNNQLFMAGFSLAPSTFWWSEIGEPEGIDPDFSTEVRSNDGDVISGMKSYLGSLMITKRKSIHLLSGDNPNDFILQELSDQYGCVSHRSIVAWNNVVWFLDSKGIMEFNGANIRCVSDRIEPVFRSMNLQAAYNNACGVHVKKYNELWWSIPANGSTINNQLIVYDYVADSWTHYDGVRAQVLFNAFGGFNTQAPFAGNYTGALVYFDSSLVSDNGQGITCSFDSPFFAARGQTTENMYRRFYLNMDPVLGFTQGITLTFKTNFGSTAQLTRSMYQNPYQSRVDFGLSARSIQVSAYHFSASLPLKVNGFSFESRFQRDV